MMMFGQGVMATTGSRLTLPTTGLIAAYDARSFVSVDGGVTASTLSDISGNGWHATQATAGQRAAISTADGYASILFDGTSDNYVTSITSSAGALTVYAVTKWTSAASSYIALLDSNNGGGGRLFVGRMSSGQYGIYDGIERNSGIAQGTTRSKLTFEAAVVGASRVWRNGIAGSAMGLSSLKALGSNPRIGRESVSAYSHFPGHLFAMSIYTGARNTAVEDFYFQEYGV